MVNTDSAKSIKFVDANEWRSDGFNEIKKNIMTKGFEAYQKIIQNNESVAPVFGMIPEFTISSNRQLQFYLPTFTNNIIDQLYAQYNSSQTNNFSQNLLFQTILDPANNALPEDSFKVADSSASADSSKKEIVNSQSIEFISSNSDTNNENFLEKKPESYSNENKVEPTQPKSSPLAKQNGIIKPEKASQKTFRNNNSLLRKHTNKIFTDSSSELKNDECSMDLSNSDDETKSKSKNSNFWLYANSFFQVAFASNNPDIETKDINFDFEAYKPFTIDSDVVHVKPLTKKEEVGILSLFSFNQCRILALQMLIKYYDSLQTEFNENMKAANVHPWLFEYENSIGSWIQMKYMSYQLRSRGLDLIPAIESLPYLLYISNVANETSEKVFDSLSSAIEAEFEINESHEQLYGLECFKFGETNRLKSNALYLLPSDKPLKKINKCKLYSEEFLPVTIHNYYINATVMKTQLQNICDILQDICNCIKATKISNALITHDVWNLFNTQVDMSSYNMKSTYNLTTILKTINFIQQNSINMSAMLSTKYSQCTVKHFIETIFFSIENFFKLLGFTCIQTIKEPGDEAVEQMPKKIIINSIVKSKMSRLANHPLPQLKSDHTLRAYPLFKKATDILQLHNFLNEGTNEPIEGPLFVQSTSADQLTQILDLLNSYLTYNFQDTIDSANKPDIEWLNATNEIDWQTTLRLPLSDINSAETITFQLTGDICKSPNDAQISCALNFLRYMYTLEKCVFKMFNIKSNDGEGFVFEVDDSTTESTSRPVIQPFQSKWVNSPDVIVIGKVDMENLKLDMKWSVKLLSTLMETNQFRFIPLQYVLSTPEHRYKLDQTVQKTIRSHDKLFKWAMHDGLFEKEDIILNSNNNFS